MVREERELRGAEGKGRERDGKKPMEESSRCQELRSWNKRPGRAFPQTKCSMVVVMVVVVCTLKLTATIWCVGCLLFGDSF